MATPVNVRNPKIQDPFLNYKFIVSWAISGTQPNGSGGKMQPVAFVSRASALTRNTQVVTHREGGAPQGPRRIPGQTEYGPITLERGVTFDVDFEEWSNKVWYYPNTGKNGNEVSLKDFRKDMTIELLNQAGQLVKRWYIFACWPSEYTALPELDGNANVVAIEQLTIQNEGWIRDTTVTEPTLPSIADPTTPIIQSFTPPAGG